ncbi:hypothetical protein EYF80_029528 [Liparis tanakae]|uniref:Uncharacterized protein n=1 Tax=Liparis tanakae TaxID=230148 RepID=A0A4Z2H4Q8_9TELE|nr:hypothetical protein EYF80_029528 [Liparis tanakae]
MNHRSRTHERKGEGEGLCGRAKTLLFGVGLGRRQPKRSRDRSRIASEAQGEADRRASSGLSFAFRVTKLWGSCGPHVTPGGYIGRGMSARAR